MLNAERVVLILKDYKERQGVKGKCKSQMMADDLGVEMDELVYLLVYAYIRQISMNIKLKEKLVHMEPVMEMYAKSYRDLENVNGRTKQTTLVKNGLPIAKKTRKNIHSLKLLIKLGYTDKEIMRGLDISRSTLWRWKKELKEMEDQKKMLDF